MHPIRSIGLAIALLALVCVVEPIGMAESTCTVSDRVPSTAHIFVKASDQGAWREDASLPNLPDLALGGGMTALFVQKRSSQSVTIVKPGQTFWTYTRYCYSGDGKLGGVGFEVRTHLGWGYRMEGTAFRGEFSASSHRFFRTKDGKAIPQPKGVADAPLGLQPALYLSVSDLPFAALLKPAANPRGKPGAAVTLARAGN